MPNCRTNTGSLGAKNPYVASGLEGKYGLWCDKNDYVCGGSRSLLNNSNHTKYAEKKEFVWMAEKVEKRLPSRYESVTALAGADDEDGNEEVEDVIEAHFSANEYIIGIHGDIVVDASQSFSFGHEIVEYWWSVDGGEFWSTGAEPAITRTLTFPLREKVVVRIVDDAGRTAEASVNLITREGEPEDNTMFAPKYVTAECANGEIVVNWTEKKHYLAKYILIRINDIDLDYVPVENLTATINEIDNINEIESIKVAWLNNNLELGEWTEVALNCPEPINLEPVETGVELANSALLAVGICALATIIVYKKYLP